MSRGVPAVLCLTALLLLHTSGEATTPPDRCTSPPHGSTLVTVGQDLPVALTEGVDSSALLRDLFREIHGKPLGSVALKNLLIHSARDLDPRGPDPCFGHGVADPGLAARILRAAVLEDKRPDLARGSLVGALSDLVDPELEHQGTTPRLPVFALIAEGSLNQGESLAFHIPVVPARELRATLVWHGPPAGVLVNDIDLRLEAPNGEVVLPWAPDPSRPFEAARQGRNSRDDVEQVRVPIPSVGWWTAIVEGYSVAAGPQAFSLILSVSRGNEAESRSEP